MTAIVGILNKKGVAIAADSAATFLDADKRVTKNEKGEEVTQYQDIVINSGDKMLRLKDKQPVAVMTVQNANLVQIPWDVIIRWYRKQRDDSGFPNLPDYIKDFMAFVNSDVIKPHVKEKNISFDNSHKTYLVFAGYGETEPYPSICKCVVTGIKEGKIQYDKGISIISDNQESKIFAEGQPDIIEAITYGVQTKRIDDICNRLSKLIKELVKLQNQYQNTPNLHLDAIDDGTIRQEVKEVIDNSKELHFKQLKDLVKGYNLQEMACLAENMIKATELHRKITFQQESVGGLIDLAVITKNDGFQWLNRKSWYEPSKGGQYGKFGI